MRNLKNKTNGHIVRSEERHNQVHEKVWDENSSKYTFSDISIRVLYQRSLADLKLRFLWQKEQLVLSTTRLVCSSCPGFSKNCQL